MDTVLVDSSLSTSMWIGPGRNDIRARSVTFVVWVAEKSMDCRSSVVRREYKYRNDSVGKRTDLLEA